MSNDATMLGSSIGTPPIAAASARSEYDLDAKVSSALAAHGNWECVFCGKVGLGKKGARKVDGGGLVHDRCRQRHARGNEIVRQERKRPAVSASLASVSPAHKIAKTDSNPAVAELLELESNCAASVVIQPTQTYQSAAERMEQLSQFGFARVPATAETRKLAWKLSQMDKVSAGQIIAGGVRQVTPPELSENSTDELRTEVEKLVKQTAVDLGIPEVEKKFVVDHKLLVSNPAKGQQFAHWDRRRDQKSTKMYTFLICCSNGSWSTALPMYKTDSRLSSSTKLSEMREVAHLLRAIPENFRSMPMLDGDIIMFEHTTPHYGVANTMPSGKRMMFFCVLTDTPEWRQDEEQVPAWLFVGEAFGWESEEFARSLVENRKHSPLERILGDFTATDYQIATDCLQRFGLLKKYKARA